MDPHLLYGIAFTVVPILLSLSVHEFAHARTALAFGDPTAKAMGRCTLNPLAHLDPIGTLAIIFIGFGWARPVPVNFAGLRPKRLGSIAVSAAGPLSNLAIAIICAVALRIIAAAGVTVASGRGAPIVAMDVVVFVLTYTILINLTLMAFNLLPLFPLDGHHIARETLPAHLQTGYMRWQVSYGRWALLAMLFAPRLMGSAGQKFNLLGMYIGRVLHPTLEFMMNDAAWNLAVNALSKFSGYSVFG